MALLAEALRCPFPNEWPDPVYQSLQAISAAAGATLIMFWAVRRIRIICTTISHTGQAGTAR